MKQKKIKFTTLILKNDNIDSIAELEGVYIFISKSTASGGNYLLKIGWTNNLKRTAKAFYDFIQTTEIKDEELIVGFYLCNDKEKCNEISYKYNMRFKNTLPDLSNLE